MYKGKTQTKQDDIEYEQACNDDPHGVMCGKCNKLNDFWDDWGWFYWFPIERGNPGSELSIPVCETCFRELGSSICER